MSGKKTNHNNSFLTARQREILSMIRQNYKKSEIASMLKITRQDVTILEKRAIMNIEKAFNTIQMTYEDGTSVRITIEKDTQILDAIREILSTGDKMNIKIRSSIPEIFTLLRICHGEKIKNGIMGAGTEVSILLDGRLVLREIA